MLPPMIQSFVVNIDVPDLEAAASFYINGLGLKPGRRLEGAVEVLGGPAPIYLLETEAGSPAAPTGAAVRDFGRHWTPVHLDLLCDDVDAAVARAVAAGATLEKPARTEVWGRIALLADPFGNGFCLIRFLGSGYDEISQPDAEQT
jgi:predicted enzyme related to lactoylglutathione lyase